MPLSGLIKVKNLLVCVIFALACIHLSTMYIRHKDHIQNRVVFRGHPGPRSNRRSSSNHEHDQPNQTTKAIPNTAPIRVLAKLKSPFPFAASNSNAVAPPVTTVAPLVTTVAPPSRNHKRPVIQASPSPMPTANQLILSANEETHNNWVKAQDPGNSNQFYYYRLSNPKTTTTWNPPIVFRYESMIACQLYDIIKNFDIDGGDIRDNEHSKQAKDVMSCCRACENTPECFSFVFSVDKCFMKNSQQTAGTGTPKNLVVSGHYNPVRTNKVKEGKMLLPVNLDQSRSSLPLPPHHPPPPRGLPFVPQPKKQKKYKTQLAQTTHKKNHCRDLKIGSKGRSARRIGTIRSGLTSTFAFDFILYVPENSIEPSLNMQHQMANLLDSNPFVDVVGGVSLIASRIVQSCLNIELCHWTALLHYEYTCSKGPMLQCDTTSNIFMTRKKHVSDIDFSMGALLPLDFFIKVKRRNGIVITDASLLIPVSAASTIGAASDVTQFKRFVLEHGVDEIRNRDTRTAKKLCANCDAKIIKEILDDATWASLGISMPTFAYDSYVRGFQQAILLLNKHGMEYRLSGGSHIGLFKLNRLLPWDAGDVDIHININSHGLGCDAWLKILKEWADEHRYMHPHVHAANGIGNTCHNYGVYAMPAGSDVSDPFSLGLITFVGEKDSSDILPTSIIHAHGVDAHVSLYTWDKLKKVYDNDVFSHKAHRFYGNNKFTCYSELQHNCILDTSGTSKDSCIELTRFYDNDKVVPLVSGSFARAKP